MKQFGVISGLPRSGSTLLCNVLNQNRDTHASSTSLFPGIASGIVTHLCNQPEYRGALHADKTAAETVLKNTLLGALNGYYGSEWLKDTVIDKSRAWMGAVDILKGMDGKMIIMIRDLRNIVASIEKQNRKSGILQSALVPYGTMIDQWFNVSEGVVGGPLSSLKSLVDRNYPMDVVLSFSEDLLERKFEKHVLVLKYENFVNDPGFAMKLIYRFLGVDEFSHDFENVENVSSDIDGHYLYKFPHEGCGKVRATNLNEYKAFMTDWIANKIVNDYRWYYEVFGYVK